MPLRYPREILRDVLNSILVTTICYMVYYDINLCVVLMFAQFSSRLGVDPNCILPAYLLGLICRFNWLFDKSADRQRKKNFVRTTYKSSMTILNMFLSPLKHEILLTQTHILHVFCYVSRLFCLRYTMTSSRRKIFFWFSAKFNSELSVSLKSHKPKSWRHQPATPTLTR
jgi:hypothetical protein